jgi:hypothetical protein
MVGLRAHLNKITYIIDRANARIEKDEEFKVTFECIEYLMRKHMK